MVLSVGKIKWQPVILTKLIGLTQTARFGIVHTRLFPQVLWPTTLASQNYHARLACSGRHRNTQCLIAASPVRGSRLALACMCVCEKELVWVSLCVAAGSGALKLLNDRTRPSLSGRRWAMHACHLYTAVSFIWSSSLSLVAPPPSFPNLCHPIPPQPSPSRLPFCNCSGIY